MINEIKLVDDLINENKEITIKEYIEIKQELMAVIQATMLEMTLADNL